MMNSFIMDKLSEMENNDCITDVQYGTDQEHGESINCDNKPSTCT